MGGIGAFVSCDPECQQVAIAELAPLGPTVAGLVWLEPGLGLLATPAGFDEVAAAVDAAAPIFVRHIAPAEFSIPLSASPADLDALALAAARLGARLDPAGSFSVQTRILGEGKLPYRRVVVNEKLSTMLEGATGSTMNARTPGQVVTVVCTPAVGYLGVSRTAQNRSAWPGGMHRFKNEEGQISRAEHKLLEALSVFAIALPEHGVALDLGAAPGGWTRVFRAKGLDVVAVDPADLDPVLRNDPGVSHVRGQVQAFRPGGRTFDVLANDMRMDAGESVEVMIRSRSWLKAGGVGFLTLKLPEEPSTSAGTLAAVRGHLARLAGNYRIAGARRLYHNRSEVTVALRA